MSETPKPRRVLNIGRRFTPVIEKKEGEPKVRKYGNKLSRRMLRRKGIAQASIIERHLNDARLAKDAVADLADNSHQRRRYIEADRLERKEARR